MIAIREPTSYEDETKGISYALSRYGEMHDGYLTLAPADRIHAGKHVPTPQPLLTITLRACSYVRAQPTPNTSRHAEEEARDFSANRAEYAHRTIRSQRGRAARQGSH